MLNQRKQLAPPSACDNCSGLNFKIVVNHVIYGFKRGEWPYGYFCFDCRAYVGCHPNTHNPLGFMSTGSVRRRRAKLHELFDCIWREGWLRRDHAYRWLAAQLDIIDVDNCHIGQLDKDQLDKAIAIMRTHKEKDYSQFKRRKEKDNAKRSEQRHREHAKIGLRKFGRN